MTNPSSDVLERLQHYSQDTLLSAFVRETCTEALTTIERLSAERLQLREALTDVLPFLRGLTKFGEDAVWRPAQRHLNNLDAALTLPQTNYERSQSV